VTGDNNSHYLLYVLSRACVKMCLTGNVVNIQSGKWVGFMSGLGAGLDSFYEYLLKVKLRFHV